MNKTIKNIAYILTVAIVLAACSPTEYKELGPPRNILTAISGQWKLIRAVQTDEDAKAKGFPFKEKDLTTLFPYTDFSLTLNLSGAAPGTFSTTPGSSPRIIKLASGNWTVDNPEYPKVITLTSGAVTETVTLGGYPVGSVNTLKLTVERRDAGTGKLLISYSYEFAKQ